MKDSIHCPRIEKLETLSVATLAGAMDGAPELEMQQAWLPAPQEEFRAARVRVAHDGEILYVLAELPDEEVWTSSTEHNQRMWLLGDVFEMFLRDLHGDRYFELHVSPSGHHLQLCFPGTETFYAGGWDLEDMVRHEPLFESRIEKDEHGWRVAAAVPSVGLFGRALEGVEWLVSFSRYDYHSDGREPILSSTSNHRVANFHRQEEWKRLHFA